MEEQEQLARDLYDSLENINEFARLLRIGQFAGSEYKSITRCHAFLEKTWKNTIKTIESNPWYIQEKSAMEALDMKTIMIGGSGEYDPKYKVKMEDVFRKIK